MCIRDCDNTISLGYDMYTSHVKNTNTKTCPNTQNIDGISNRTILQSKHMIARDLFSVEEALDKQDSWCC